jgi:hypothetical protein
MDHPNKNKDWIKTVVVYFGVVLMMVIVPDLVYFGVVLMMVIVPDP